MIAKTIIGAIRGGHPAAGCMTIDVAFYGGCHLPGTASPHAEDAHIPSWDTGGDSPCI